MNHRQLSYFLEVYKKRNITQAAKNLFISPQAISKTIATLEDELKVSLFVHDKNRIIPTKEAAKLALHAERILLEYAIIESQLFTEQNVKEPLLIACSFDAPLLIGADFFMQFQMNHPDIKVVLREATDSKIFSRLESGKHELAITASCPDLDHYVCENILSDNFVLLVNKANPLSQKSIITYSDLNNQRLIAKDISSFDSINQLSNIATTHSSVDVIMESSNSQLIIDMVEQNIGIAMLPSKLVSRINSEEIATIPFEGEVNKKIYLIHRRDIVLGDEYKLFKEALLDHFRILPIYR